jgi:flavin reductase (DIM6/NTAB) family NADH-FMN oxidoreductase RutF
VNDFHVVTEPADLNQALFRVTHGLYVLTAAAGQRLNGQILDALMQVTNAPPRIAIGVGKRSLTHEMIATSGRFVANVIDRTDSDCEGTIRHFGFQSGRDVDKFANRQHERSEHGVPILPNALAYYECTVEEAKTIDLKTHSIFVGLVNRAGTREDGEALTYNEYRRSLRKG